VPADAGLAEFTGPRTGHGIGIGIHEAPSVIEGNHAELVAGTVVTVEPGVYLPGRYGIRIEDTVAVTDDGPRRLTRGARELATRAP
jgi:Xaa-Pro dipeptidase